MNMGYTEEMYRWINSRFSELSGESNTINKGKEEWEDHNDEHCDQESQLTPKMHFKMST